MHIPENPGYIIAVILFIGEYAQNTSHKNIIAFII